MRILFVVNRLAHVRHFDRAVRLLADRGHDVCLASQDDDVELWGVLVRQPRIRAIVAPRNRGDGDPGIKFGAGLHGPALSHGAGRPVNLLCLFAGRPAPACPP